MWASMVAARASLAAAMEIGAMDVVGRGKHAGDAMLDAAESF